MSDEHKQLQDMAINWLYSRGCSVYAKEVPTWNGIADAMGVNTSQRQYGKTDTVYYVEAKISRADLICRKQKACYALTERLTLEGVAKEKGLRFGEEHEYAYPNDVDFFYFIIGQNLTVEPELYPLWGVIDHGSKVIRKAHRMKKNRDSHQVITDIAHVLVYKAYGKKYL